MTCLNAKLWQTAWDSELPSIIDPDIFSKAVTVPKDYNAITAKVVWDIKYAENGSITRYKACLVARGFTHVYGVYYEEIFASTICYNILRIFLAIATKKNWKVYQVNIVIAFLAGKLDEIIYLRVLYLLQYLLRDYVQVLQCIYRLKQAPYMLHLLLKKFLKSISFTFLSSDLSVFTNGKVIITRLMLGVYIDDLLIAEEYEKDIIHIK